MERRSNVDKVRSLRGALEIRACGYDQHSVLNFKRKVDVHLPINGFYEAQPQTRKARKGQEECSRVVNSLRVSKYVRSLRVNCEMISHRKARGSDI